MEPGGEPRSSPGHEAGLPSPSNGSGGAAAPSRSTLQPSAWSLAPSQNFQHNECSPFQVYTAAVAQQLPTAAAGVVAAPVQQLPPQGQPTGGVAPARQPAAPSQAKPPLPARSQGPAATAASIPASELLLPLPVSQVGDQAAANAINAAYSFIHLSQLMQQGPASSSSGVGQGQQNTADMQAARQQLLRQLELTVLLQREMLCRLIMHAQTDPPLRQQLEEAELWGRLQQAAGPAAAAAGQPGVDPAGCGVDRAALLMELAPLLIGSAAALAAGGGAASQEAQWQQGT